MRTAIVWLLLSGVAWGYEPPTHAGVAERAAISSTLHKQLVDRMGRSLGLYEPLKIVTNNLDYGELARRLARLDREGGYAPEDNKQTALGWLTAGAVLEGMPPDRMRHHFYDPTRGAGLDESGGFRTRLTAAGNGVGSVRGIFTAQSFDGTGRPAPDWALAPRSENEWGYQRYLDERERAAKAKTPGERDDALARALLAAGHVLRVIAEMGEPAHVRNDFRVALEQEGDRYGRWVAEHYGKFGVPEPLDGEVATPHLRDLIVGLAKRTARRFFSAGTLPSSGRYAQPEAHATGTEGFVAGEVKHLASYRRTRGGVSWWLDDRSFEDYAQMLLPEIGRVERAAIDLLFRGTIEMDSGPRRVSAVARDTALGAGTFTLFADDDKGERKQVFERRVTSARDGDELGVADRPDWARHFTGVFRGQDAHGEPIVVVQEFTIK
jgi:hypothetical protein